MALYRFTMELPPDSAVRDTLMRTGVNVAAMPSLAAPPVELASEALRGLGLRLEKRRAQIEIIVVDRIERTPTDN